MRTHYHPWLKQGDLSGMSLPRLGLLGPNYTPSVWLEAEKEIDGSRYNSDGPWVVLL